MKKKCGSKERIEEKNVGQRFQIFLLAIGFRVIATRQWIRHRPGHRFRQRKIKSKPLKEKKRVAIQGYLNEHA
jgi:hypothetical protein